MNSEPVADTSKQIKKRLLLCCLLSATCYLFFVACNNFFHDLIPPDGNLITSFTVNGQADDAVITDYSVMLTVQKGIAIHALIPQITVSPRATIVPVTLDYVQAAFPGVDLLKEALSMYQTNDLAGYVHNLIKETPGFTIPALDMPIDFTFPVIFFVISGQGTIRQYTVTVFEDTGEPRLMGLRFAKYENPELVSDALCLLNEHLLSISALASYPAEMSGLSFALIPSFDILGDSLEVDGVEIVSGVDAIIFSPNLNIPQSKTLTVTRGTERKDYTLTVVFAEDPDTIRSITDFRFTRMDNPGIAANAVASIINTDNTGSITVQVFYSGARPSTLTPRFVSPGTVSVDGIQQSTGDSHDFSSPLEYRVISRNGLYVRTYAVRTEFINLVTDAPRITSFRFSQSLNHDLVQDTEGEIGDGFIMIDAHYASLTAPEILVPEFSAQGIVKVSGSVQVSGASPQNFSRQIKYTVENPENPLLTREYWVQTRLVRNTSSDASISSFGFYPEDNPGLDDPLAARIDQGTGRITVFAPIGSGVTSRVMVPRFSALGQVSVGGAVQSSGSSGLMFDGPVTYTVISANGLVSRDYEVTVRELKSTIYVNHNAWGDNDGTNWANAFRSLKDACEAAAQFPDDVPKEIWIAAGTYKPGTTTDDSFPVMPNTSYIGGFAGWETAKSQRNVTANTVVISGDLGGGVRSDELFYPSQQPLNGNLAFEALEFNTAGTGFSATSAGGTELRIDNCAFTDFIGPAVNSTIGSAFISDTVFSGTAVMLNASTETVMQRVRIEDSQTTPVLSLSGSGNKTLEQVSISRSSGRLSQFAVEISGSGDLTIDGLELHDIARSGLDLIDVTGRKMFSNIDGRNIGADPIRAVTGAGAFTLADSNFYNIRGIHIRGSSVTVLNTTIEASQARGTSSALEILTEGNVIVEGLTIDGVLNSGMWISCGGQALISGSVIRNFGTDRISSGRHGISLTGSGSSVISNTTIENVEGHSSESAIWSSQPSLTITGSLIKNIMATGFGSFGGGLNSMGTSYISISNSRFENCIARFGGAIWTGGYDDFVTLSVTDTDFINCTAQIEVGIINLTGTGEFKNSKFIHDSNLYVFDQPSTWEDCMLKITGGQILFDDCSFINLRSTNTTAASYIFNRFSGGNPVSVPFDIILQNSEVNIPPGGSGLLFLYGGDNQSRPPDILLMDGVSITNTNTQMPIIRLQNDSQGYSTPGTFRFKLNNVYNDIPLNNITAITGLALTGVISLENGAMPVIVP